ncbi:uncharacterized protein METZ01_LOCUS243784, partial [marine metagenome]
PTGRCAASVATPGAMRRQSWTGNARSAAQSTPGRRSPSTTTGTTPVGSLPGTRSLPVVGVSTLGRSRWFWWSPNRSIPTMTKPSMASWRRSTGRSSMPV